MRQIFSIRFFMAVGAVVGLFFLLTTIFAAREVIEGGDDPAAGAPEPHRIDFVDRVFSSRNADFRIDDGVAASDTELIIDGSRSLRIVAGTPGENLCPDLGELGRCAVVADLLGEAVVWFALVPMGSGDTVEFPAIDVLEDGRAHLVNGWQLPYAPVLDRRCRDAEGDEVEFDSYREFREVLGDDFTSIYSVTTRRLEAVVCGERVAYAPPPNTTPDAVPDTVPDTGPESTPVSGGDPSDGAPADTRTSP
ncbi:MAG: hypothetical protein CL424_11535 [Acidimicrobiaceae bacterium]|nr:hypothetical protein [Acidimicrobiaceae bacterium]